VVAVAASQQRTLARRPLLVAVDTRRRRQCPRWTVLSGHRPRLRQRRGRRTLPRASRRPLLDMAAASVSAQAAGVALPGGRRSCSPHLEVAVTCGSSVLEHCVRPRAAGVAMSTVATARATRCPRWRLTSGSRPDTSPGRQDAGTGLAADVSLATLAGHRPSGHHPSGRRSFRKQRTVNPPLADCRSTAACPDSLQLPLLFFQGRPCGRPPSRRQRGDGHRGTGLTPLLGTVEAVSKRFRIGT
jgi:hypothetical protein